MVSAQGGSADEAEAHLFSMQSGGVFFCLFITYLYLKSPPECNDGLLQNMGA